MRRAAGDVEIYREDGVGSVVHFGMVNEQLAEIVKQKITDVGDLG